MIFLVRVSSRIAYLCASTSLSSSPCFILKAVAFFADCSSMLFCSSTELLLKKVEMALFLLRMLMVLWWCRKAWCHLNRLKSKLAKHCLPTNLVTLECLSLAFNSGSWLLWYLPPAYQLHDAHNGILGEVAFFILKTQHWFSVWVTVCLWRFLFFCGQFSFAFWVF